MGTGGAPVIGNRQGVVRRHARERGHVRRRPRLVSRGTVTYGEAYPVRSSCGLARGFVADDHDVATPDEPAKCPSQVGGVADRQNDQLATSSPRPGYGP